MAQLGTGSVDNGVTRLLGVTMARSRHAARQSAYRKSWVGATLVDLSTTNAAASASTVNLVAHPTLSDGTADWYTRDGGSLAVVPGHDGHPAIRLRHETAAPLTPA